MISVSDSLCEHCGSCTAVCPTKSVRIELKNSIMYLFLDKKSCTICGQCVRICPMRALKLGRRTNS